MSRSRTGAPRPISHTRVAVIGLLFVAVVDLVDRAPGQRVALSANTPASRSYDASRSACACTMVDDHQLVDAGAFDERVEPARTDSGSPTTCDAVQPSTS